MARDCNRLAMTLGCPLRTKFPEEVRSNRGPVFEGCRIVGAFLRAAIELREPRSLPLGVAAALGAVEQLRGEGQPLVRREAQRFLENSRPRMLTHLADSTCAQGRNRTADTGIF